MKKILLAILGLAFAFAVTSCGDQGTKNGKRRPDPQKCTEKFGRHHERW